MAGGPRAAHWVGDAAVGIALAAAGAAYWWMAQGLAAGAAANPGPGAFPRFLGLAIAAAGIACAVRAYLARDGEAVAWAEPCAVLSAAALLIVASFFDDFGFVATTAPFLAFQFWLLSELGVARAIMAGGGATAAIWLAFEKILNVGLPDGPWGF